MARYPEDRYVSYAEFIAQLEDAKRRITNPNFKETQKKDVAIITAGHSSKYGIWLALGVVAIVVILLGLFIWKGSALVSQSNTAPREMSGYNPDAVPVKPNAPAH